jgi:DNA recombination protein RmuC
MIAVEWLALLVVAALVVIVVLALRAPGGAALRRLDERQSELIGRVGQIGERTASLQGEIQERLQAQERDLTKAVDERLHAMSLRLDARLDRTDQATTTTVGDLRERLGRIDEAQRKLTDLSKDVVSLQDILSNKQARGAFGEVQLEAVLRDQLPPGQVSIQHTLTNGKRADALILLAPPFGPLAIDAKFPREGYDALRASGEGKSREEALRVFSTSVMNHVRAIATSYVVPGETAEAALMFVPSEAIYAEIFASAPDVVDKARRARVFLVSPTTLWAVLNTMRALMKDARMKEQSAAIQKEVGLMLADIGRLAERIGQLETHFSQAEKDIREIRTSADKVIRRGDRIRDAELDPPAA